MKDHDLCFEEFHIAESIGRSFHRFNLIVVSSRGPEEIR